MKTTIELNENILDSAKKVAARDRTTLRTLLEDGPRRVLAESQVRQPKAFKHRNLSVGGGKLMQANPERWLELEDEELVNKFANTKK